MRPKIKLTIIDCKGEKLCHRGHRVGQSFDFDKDRGRICPMALHAGFPYIDILRYEGRIPGEPEGTARFCCPDPDTINIFKVEKITDA